MLEYVTAGESHGRALVATVIGLPAGIRLSSDGLQRELTRRRCGYGRGERMELEKDAARFLAGVRQGRTLAGPVAVLIENTEWETWSDVMSVEETEAPSQPVTLPRPGHADLVGSLKFGLPDLRDVIERASARETAARVAAGYCAKQLLEILGISVVSRVVAIADITIECDAMRAEDVDAIERSSVRCGDVAATKKMEKRIDAARESGTTLGGVVETWAFGCPPGLGTFTVARDRLDARIGAALLSIPSVRAVEIGEGIAISRREGHETHDIIWPDPKKTYTRQTNNAGGLEGGMTNGQPVVARAFVKPIPTTRRPLPTVDIDTGQQTEGRYERSDICVVPAIGVIAESGVAFELARAVRAKFGGDSVDDMTSAFRAYCDRIGWA